MPWDTAVERNRWICKGTMQSAPWGWPPAPEIPVLDSRLTARLSLDTARLSLDDPSAQAGQERLLQSEGVWEGRRFFPNRWWPQVAQIQTKKDAFHLNMSKFNCTSTATFHWTANISKAKEYMQKWPLNAFSILCKVYKHQRLKGGFTKELKRRLDGASH